MTLFDTDELPTVPEPSVRVRFVVAYDGRPYRGMAVNAGVKTVGGTLQGALQQVLGHAVRLSIAGRTDAGVHAWGQVVSFDAAADGLDLTALQRSINKLCGPSIAVRAADVVPPTFDARHSAVARAYRYTILNRDAPDPFLAATSWHVDEPLDLAVMRLAADPLIGEHDFSSFCRVPKGVDRYSMVRRVLDAGWVGLGDGVLRFDIAATAFCHQMVRAVVGLLVDVGRGKRKAGDVAAIIRAQDRSASAPIAPAHGLCLWHVEYGDDERTRRRRSP